MMELWQKAVDAVMYETLAYEAAMVKWAHCTYNVHLSR